MAEQVFFSSNAELEASLGELARHVAFPDTPELALTVRRRLATAPVVRQRARFVREPGWQRARFVREPGWQRAVVVALVMVLVLVGTALAVSPDMREALAARLGLRGVSIEHVPAAPVPSVVSSPSLPGAPPGATLGLGTPSTLDAARAQVGFAVLLPSGVGQPDAVYVRNPDQVSLVYAPREGLPRAPSTASVGLLVTEFHASLDATLFGKGIPPGARLEEVQVRGTRGYFISGAPHAFFYRDAKNNVQDEHSRLAGNTLLWQADGITYRLESALDRDSAIRLAETLR